MNAPKRPQSRSTYPTTLWHTKAYRVACTRKDFFHVHLMLLLLLLFYSLLSKQMCRYRDLSNLALSLPFVQILLVLLCLPWLYYFYYSNSRSKCCWMKWNERDTFLILLHKSGRFFFLLPWIFISFSCSLADDIVSYSGNVHMCIWHAIKKWKLANVKSPLNYNFCVFLKRICEYPIRMKWENYWEDISS